MTAPTARLSFDRSDAQSSRDFHQVASLERRLLEPAHEDATKLGDAVKPFSFGGLDGVNTTFAVVAGATGADLDIAHVLVMGFVCLLAGAFSMGLGEWSSSKAEIEYRGYERDREAWEMDNYPEGEIDEMVDIYKRKGMSEEHAKTILTTMAQYKEIFVDHMMVEELGMLCPAEAKDPKYDGLIMFFAFAGFGLVPLLSFLVLAAVYGTSNEEHNSLAFGASCALTSATLVGLGAVMASLRRQGMLQTCLQMVFNGFISGSVAYITGHVAMSLLS